MPPLLPHGTSGGNGHCGTLGARGEAAVRISGRNGSTNEQPAGQVGRPYTKRGRHHILSAQLVPPFLPPTRLAPGDHGPLLFSPPPHCYASGSNLFMVQLTPLTWSKNLAPDVCFLLPKENNNYYSLHSFTGGEIETQKQNNLARIV